MVVLCRGGEGGRCLLQLIGQGKISTQAGHEWLTRVRSEVFPLPLGPVRRKHGSWVAEGER